MRVIHDLDLVIHPGERVGIVGLNGHGKTTLFYAIAGLTGWQRGSILLNGRQIGRTRSQGPGRYTHQIVRQGLAIMPQGDEIFHGLTVEEHLDSGAFTPRGLADPQGAQGAGPGRSFDPLRKLMKTPVGRLSGGERRMVSIGRGLMTDAKLYLADEPSLGLAPKIGMAVMDALLAIELKDSAMFIAEQNVALLEGRVDRIIGMHAGKLKGEASSSLFVCIAAREERSDGHRLRPHQRDHGRLHLRPDSDRRIDHLVEPRPHQSRLRLHLLLRRLCGLAGRDSSVIRRHPCPDRRRGILAGRVGGIIVCLLVFIPLHDKPDFTSRGMIATLAISLIGSQVFLMVFGPTSKSLPDIFGRGKVKFFGITLTADKIGIVVCSVADAASLSSCGCAPAGAALRSGR